MMEITLEYWNKLADQTILICSLMSGFSIAVVISLMVYETKNRFADYILKAATMAAGCFLVSVFTWTKILMMTSPGYPLKFVEADLLIPRIVGAITLLLGIISLSVVLSLSGWIKSKSTGIFTTIIGVVTFILIAIMFS